MTGTAMITHSTGLPRPLDRPGALDLATALGPTPETVISVHLLRRDLALAYVAGEPSRFRAAVIRNLSFATDELTAFGDDPEEIWHILRRLADWRYVNVAPAIAPRSPPTSPPPPARRRAP